MTAPGPGYDYVASRYLSINNVIAFAPGQYVPDDTVTAQGWVVPDDVNVIPPVLPSVLELTTGVQTLTSDQQAQVQANLGVPSVAQLGTKAPLPVGSTAGYVATVGSDGNSITYAAASGGGGSYDTGVWS